MITTSRNGTGQLADIRQMLQRSDLGHIDGTGGDGVTTGNKCVRSGVTHHCTPPAAIASGTRGASHFNGSMYGCSGDSYSAGTVEGFVAQTDCLNKGLVIQGTTIKVPYDKQVPGLPAQPGAGGGYMAPSLVTQAWNHYNGALKGLMTWSINWDGSKGWTFGDNVKGLF